MKSRKRNAPHGTQISAIATQMESDLSAIRRALRKPLEAHFAKGELTLPQKAVMQAVVGSQGISLKELSRQVSLAHSTVSGIADRLEKRGMIERRPDPADGRISRIHVSAPVAAFLRDQMPALATGPLDAALRRINDAERAKLAKALRLLRELLEGV
jgi:DNA-binding MarR family transcriptional regulator